jgi:hypothetical protein
LAPWWQRNIDNYRRPRRVEGAAKTSGAQPGQIRTR